MSPSLSRAAHYLVRRTTEVRIDGIATYSRFRQFTVTTTEKPKP